jgi:hypothetical protein
MQRKIVLGVEEIESVRLKCAADGCGQPVTFVNTGTLSFPCGHGGQVHKVDEPLGEFILSLALSRETQEKAKAAGFSISLEFSEPV